MDQGRIRPATEKDLDQIVSLLQQLSVPNELEEDLPSDYLSPLFRMILSDTNYYLKVYENSKIIGTATLNTMYNLSHSGRPKGSIQDVVVSQEARGLGVGKLLIQDLLEEAKRKDCYKVILNCREHNVPFYEKCGFHHTGELEMRIDL